MSIEATYVSMTLKNVLREQEDQVSALLFSAGALGVSEDLDWV